MNGETFSGEFAFSQPVINIGSDAGNDIVLIGSSVGTFHAMMHYDSNRWFVASLDPDKRTFVNGHSIDANGASLQSGSVLTIGDYRMTVRLNGINTDIIVQFQGQLGSEAIAAHQVNAEANIQLAINGTPPTEINAGGSVEYELTVTNAGPLVANMQLQLQGVPTAWAQIIPPVINLNEGRRGSFVVRISPPRDSSAEAGVYNIHFVATSPNYPRETATADTALNVLPYTEFMLNGPMPRVLKLSRRKPSQLADLVVINNSNSTSNFMVQTYDDANELQFTYERGGAGMYQNQEIVSVRAGDHVRVPIMVTSKKIPFVAFSSHVRHYSVNVTPSDRPGDTQSVMGEVNVRPFIRTYVLLLLVALVAILGLFVFQPYIRQFDGADGKRTQVVLAGSSAQINWRVSVLASKVTLDDGSGPQEVSKNGSMYVSPSSSTTYVIRSENILSRFLGFEHTKSLQVLSIPNRPKINLFTTDAAEALFNQTVTFSWAVEPNADKATIMINKQAGELPPEQYSASQQETLTSDTLAAIKAENSSGYEMKSIFVSVSPDVIDLLRYAVWVRPNGIAVPNDNDTRKQTRWGSLQLTTDTSNTLKPALSNPQPAAQSNTLEIPDNFNNTAGTVQSYNPEQLSLNGQAIQQTPYSYTPSVQGAPSTELLVGPSVTRERTDRNPSDSSGLDISSVMHQDSAPVTSPEGTGNGFDPNFTIKLMEVIEDPMSESGYRVIDYFPDYQLQPGEQILVEWNVDGVAKVKIDNLSDDLKNSGAEYANPEKPVTYVLHAQVGDVEQAYSLPVRVAGDADNGEGSGLNCELKANATTLKVPGTVMLTWKGGGNGRVQLVSSAKAEADSADAEKKKEEEAKEKGEKYEKPTQPQPLEGGVIADYLQPSGFMRVNVDKQTTFMLNCYDSSNNVICTKSVEVKYEGGNDKADLKLEIVSVTDSQGVERPVYTVGQTVQYTVRVSGFDAKKVPSGNVTISDSVSSCSVTLPTVTCSVQAKKTGKLVLTAVYSGDDNYNKATAYGTETVIDKLTTTIDIQEALKSAADKANLITQLKFDAENEWGLIPSGTITFTAGSGTCDLDVLKDTLTCDGKVVESENDPYLFRITDMLLADAAADRITAAYKGDDYFSPSTSKAYKFDTLPTKLTLSDAVKPASNLADVVALLTYDEEKAHDLTPKGTITFTVGSGACVLTITDPKDLKLSCNGEAVKTENIQEYKLTNMLLTDTSATTIKAEYSGDGFFLPSASDTITFFNIDTESFITTAFKTDESHVTLISELTWDSVDNKSVPTGTVSYTIGSGTCILTFTNPENPELTCNTENEEGIKGIVIDPVDKEEIAKGKITFTIKNMLISDKTADRVTAAYSGDSRFNPSTSTAFLFQKVDTETIIVEAYKPFLSVADIVSSLTWSEEDWRKIGCGNLSCPKPTGTLTFTVTSPPKREPSEEEQAGSTQQKCVLDIEKNTFDCSDSVSRKENDFEYRFDLLNILLEDPYSDRVLVVYSGDTFYNGSTSAATMFNRVLTETIISDVDTVDDNVIDFTVEITWRKEDEPKNDSAPTGTLIFNSCVTEDSCIAVCKMDVATGETDCGAQALQYGSRYQIKGMSLGDGDPVYILAEYSGDNFFHPSSSQPWYLSDHYNTQTDITRAFKPDDTRVNFEGRLTWGRNLPEDVPEELSPGKKISFIASNSMVDTATCIYDIDIDQFSCNGVIIDKDDSDIIWDVVLDPENQNYEFIIKNMPIGQISADRIRAVYSGDDKFNPSTSKMVMFKTVGTAINIKDASKTADNVVSMTTVLNWDEFVSGGVRPSGTIKYISGTRTCTLDISGDPFKFTDCDGNAVYTYNESDRKLSITITGLGMTGAGGTIKAEYSGSGAYLKSESPEVNFGKIGTELDIDDSKTYKTDTSHANVEADLKWKKEDAGEQNPSGTVTFTIGSTACTLNITANTLSGCEAAKFNVTGPEDDPGDPTLSKYHLTIGDVLFEGTADRVKAEYSGDAAFNPSSSTSLFRTVPTEITIVNDDTYKPYRPNAGYANFNTILTWDEGQAAGRTPGGTITFTPVNSTACVYTISTGKMDCEGKVTYVTDHYEIRNLLMSNSNSDRIQAKYSGDGFFEESTSTTVLFDMSDTATKIMNAAKSPENVVDMNVSVTSTKPHPDGRQPVGTIVFTSGTKTCTLDISGSPARFTDCEGTVVYNADNNYYEIKGLVMGDTSGESIFAKYSGDSFFKESTSPTVDFTKVDTELEITKAYKPGSQNLLDLVVALSWDKTKAENKAPTGTIQFTIGSDTCVLSKLETDEPGFNCKGENTKITREKSEPGDSDTWSYTWTIANILLTNNTADRVKAEYKGDAIFNPSSSDTVLFKTVPTEIAVSSAFKTGTDHADITAALSWDNGLAEGRVPTGTIKFTAGSGSCTLDIETKALSCEPKTGTVSDDRKTYSVIGMLLDDKTADRVSVEYSGDGFFEPSVSSKVLFQTIPTDLMISNAKLTPPGFIRLTAELSWIDTPPVGKTPAGTIKFTSGTGTCTLDISASPVKFTDCDGRVESTVSEDGKKQTYTITNMFFGGKAGTDVKAEYSGDGLFLASASDKLAFDKLDTTLVISDAYKPEVSLTNSTVTLSWLEEDAGGNKPSGTVKLTIGGSTCTLNMADDSFSCSGESTKITRSEGETVSDAKTYGYIRWVFENVLLSDEKADRIKAEYSGDTFFNDSSSVTVLFKTIPTDLTITNGDKKSSGLIDLTMDLSWTDTPPANVLPDGTIKLTSGSSTCTVSLSGDTARLTDCQGNSPVVTVSADRKKLTISMTGLNMGEKTGDGVKAEYSGNSIFLASASDSLFFNKINTTLTIDPNEVYKSGEGLLNMISKLSWDAEKAGGKLPTGTITYTIGSDSCVLDIETKAFTCSGTDTDIQRTDADGSFEWAFKNILLSNNTADRVKAVYSGDGAFNTSSSITVLFKTVETTLNIYDQSKAFSRVNMTVALSWVDAAPKDKKPAGTIKLIAGTSSCSMDMGADPLKLDCDANASVTLLPSDPDDPQKVSYRIENFTYFGAGVESIKAQYSGDGCFLPSESNTIAFNKKDTKLTIDSSAISKPDELTANLNVTLSSDDVQADVDEMTGTIKFTIGSDICTYDITAQTFSCSGETTKISEVKDPENRKITWTFENVVLSSGNNADRVKADYSGNDGYNPSTSPIVFFTKVNTSLAIPSATKSNAGLITMTGEFSWIETPPAGKIPGGTIKFVSGTAVCTLDINADPLKFSDCPGTVTVNKDEENKKYTYTVTDMNMGDKVGDEIKLEYSGDGTFQPSSSDPYSFVKVDTKLVIDANETFRTNDLTGTVLAMLTWTKADADGKTPTGTVKFTIGPDVCTLDIVSEEFNCYGAATIIKIQDIPTEAADPETGKSLSIKEIMLSTGNNADRIKAEYSGDAIFNPSASSTVLFKTIETELDIHDQKKLATGLVNLATDLTWAVTPPTGNTPAGTIKYTSGSITCTLNLASKKFTDCEGTAEITFGDGIAAVQVTNLNMGRNMGTTIKAEYSGDGCFLTSVSSEEELVYVKLIPELEIIRAYKPGDPSLVNMIVTLEWDEAEAMEKKPTGTITFTMDKNTCNLTITGDPDKDTISCSGSDTKIERTDEDGQYKWTMKNVLLTDPAANNVRGKYNGDDVFDTDESNTVKFYTVETEISILNDDDIMPYKPVEGYVNFSSALSWDNEDPALDWDMSGTKRLPGGTITYTPMAQDSDAGKCVLTISTGKLSCEGSVTGSVIQYGISRMLLPNFKADRIKAEYSGDGFFEPSISTTVLFRTSDTTTTITNAKKTQDNLVFMDIEIRGALEHPEGRKPLGTVKITSGTKSCTLDTTDDPANAKFTECNGTVVYDADKNIYRISDLDMGKDAGATINAVYSGDNAFFNGSTSPTIDFLKLDTFLFVDRAVKSSSTTADFTITLFWDTDEIVKEAPTGTVKLTIGSDTCSLDIAAKTISCSTSTTYIEEDSSLQYGYYFWNLYDVLLSNGNNADRVKAEYSGDATFNPSVSDTEMFTTVPTKLAITLAEKPDADHATLNADLTWEESANVEGRTPTGTVKFTAGSGSCTLTLSTKALSCEQGGVTVSGSEAGKLHMEILSMLLDDKTADRVKAEYSGDGYFVASTSTKVIFKKYDVTLEITQITDESGKEHGYFIPEQKVRIVTNLAGAQESPAPTGTITVSIDTATCTITLPQNACTMTLPKLTGDLPLRAVYSGDNSYNGSEAQSSVTVKEMQSLNLEIIKVTDAEGTEQYEYSIGQDAVVVVKITDIDEAEIPTGDVVIKVDSSTCNASIVYPDEFSCKLKLPKVSGTYEVTAEYPGNTYYNKATSAPKEILVDKYDITFEITSIKNVVTDRQGNTQHIKQPYYVYTPNQQGEGGQGQTIQVCAELSNYTHGDPNQSAMIVIQDLDHDDGAVLVSFPVSDKCGTFDVRKYTGEITLTATFPGDENYTVKKAVNNTTDENKLIVQNKIDPQFTLYSAHVDPEDATNAYISFRFDYDRTLPYSYGVNHKEDLSLPDEPYYRVVTFTLKNGNTIIDQFDFNLKDETLDASHTRDNTEIKCDENNYCSLKNVHISWAFIENRTKIEAKYEGSRYFFEANSGEKDVIKDRGYTKIELKDVLKIDNPVSGSTNGHMFLKADMEYDPIVSDITGAKPKGSLLIKMIKSDGGTEEQTGEKSCAFDLSSENNNFECGTLTQEGNLIHFVIRNLDVPSASNKVTVEFKRSEDDQYFNDSNIAEESITTEDRPTIAFVETETESGDIETGAEKTSSTTADLTFTVSNEGSLTRSYEVYDRVKLGSTGDTEKTCTFIIKGENFQWQGEICTGKISRSYDSNTRIYTYSITNFEGIIEEEDNQASATLMNDLNWVNEYPTDTADYWHRVITTVLNVKDPLKYMDARAFLTFELLYDEEQASKYGKEPTGTIHLTSVDMTDSTKTECLFYLDNSGEPECSNGWDKAELKPYVWETDPKDGMKILNVKIGSGETEVSLFYSGDEYFAESPEVVSVDYISEKPEIEIRNATYTDGTNGKVVYADFTITGMGELSEKYHINEAIRFDSKSVGNKHCTYNRINQSFDEDCAGDLRLGENNIYTLIGLTNLYTANTSGSDTDFSVTVVTENDYLPLNECATCNKNYAKLDTGIVISDTLKVKPFSANDTHAFLTVDFRYDAEVGGRYGVEPSGTLTFSATGGSCTYNLRTKTASGCVVEKVESASSDGLLHLLVKNLIVAGNATVVNVSYADDAYFAEKDESRGFDHEAHPNIHITDAIKTTSTKADVTLVVTDPEILANVYGSFFRQIRIGSNGTRFSYINIGNIMTGGGTSGTASIINGSGTVTWTKENTGYYTFEIKNWTGPIAAADWNCYAALVSSYLEESEYPHDECEFEHRTSGPVTMSVSDIYAAQVKHIYLTAVMDYDPDIADSYNELPTGTLTIKGDGGSEKTCAFDLKVDPPTFDCGTVELDKTGHKATFVFRNYEVSGSVSRVSVKYNGDAYFNASDEGSGTVITADPVITIEYPIQTQESNRSHHGYVAFTVDEGFYPEKYKIYQRINLYSKLRSSSSRGVCTFERDTLSLLGDCHADEITLNGNQYVIKNLWGTINGRNFIQSGDEIIGVELGPYNEGWSSGSSYPSAEDTWWWRISISGELTDVIKYSRDHAAVTTTLSLSERGQQAADFWGMSPAIAAGTMEFKAGSTTCTVDLATETFTGCEGEVEVTGNAPVTIKVRNLRATDLGPSLLIAEYHPNRFFDHWQKEYVTFQNKIPAIAINTAAKTSNTSANLEITVYGNEYADIYGPLYNRIRLAAHNDAYTEIDISGILAGTEASGTITGTSGFEEVNWTRNGNNVTFNVTGWKENITADDKQCTAWLGNSDVSVLPIDHSPKSDPKDFSNQKGSITLTKKNDGLRAINDNAYLDVVLDYDPDTAAAFRKPYGKVTFMAQDSALHKWIKTCTYDLNYLGDLVCDEGGSGSATVIEKDDDNHNATIRLKSFHIYNADSIYVLTSDDNFYTDSSRNIPVTKEIPTLTLSAPVKRTDSRGYTKGWVQFTIKSGPLTEYYQPYSRIDLHSIPSSGTDAVVGINFPGTPSFDDTLVTGTIDMQHDADTYTYSYVIKNLENLVRSNDARMRADLRSVAAGAVSSNESGFVKISSTIDLQDLLVVIDRNNNYHAFGKIIYSFADLAKIYDIWPTRYMNVKSYWSTGYRYGHINVETGALGSDAQNDFGNAVFTPVQDEAAHTLQITMKDVSVGVNTRQLVVDYNDGSNGYPVDGAFNNSSSEYVSYNVVTPAISINKAFKHPLSVDGSTVPAADISFTLTGYDDLLDKWGVYQAIELRSKNGNTSGVCQIDLPWDSEHPSMTCSGTITKEGNTFSIKDWRGLTSSSDSSVEVALVSKYSDIAGARNEKDYEKTGLEVRISDALLMDSKYRFMKITLTPENPEYSFALSDIWISTGDDGCKYSISTGENFCDCRIDKTESGGSVHLSVEGWERPVNGSSYAYKATYLEDNYFNYALAQQTSVMVSLPTVRVNSINTAAKEIDIELPNYTDYYSKYSIIENVVFKSIAQSFSSATNFKPSEMPDGETTPGLDNMVITRNGNQFHVSNLPYVDSRYRSMRLWLYSASYNTGSGYRKYWSDESIYTDVPLTSGFTSPAPSNSGAPVSISVGDLQPIGGQ